MSQWKLSLNFKNIFDWLLLTCSLNRQNGKSIENGIQIRNANLQKNNFAICDSQIDFLFLVFY